MGNKNLAPGDVPINLKGIGIGNGLTDPEIQYQYYGAWIDGGGSWWVEN
jgi:hypothetical protein